MGSRKDLVGKLDPTIKATTEEVALVIETGTQYMRVLAVKKKNLYRMCESIDEAISRNALQGIKYDKANGGMNCTNHGRVFHILQLSELQYEEHQKEFNAQIFRLAQEEEKLMCIYNAYVELPYDESKLLEEFYKNKKTAKQIIKEIYRGKKMSMRTFWRKKEAALRKVADNCRYNPPDTFM